MSATSATTSVTTICDGCESPHTPVAWCDAPLSPNGASLFDGRSGQIIESGYRKNAEICGFWTAQPPMNGQVAAREAVEMATESLVKDLRQAVEQARAL